MQTLCQATQSELATVEIESQSADGPYRLCDAAAERLQRYCLRPLEWYRLAVIHGPFEYYLHDDFYDEQGTAYQPFGPILDPELWPIPLLDDVSSDLSQLLDYAFTRWWLEDDVMNALARFSPAPLLSELKQRYAQKRDHWFTDRLDEIAGRVVGAPAEAFVLERLDRLSPEDRVLAIRSAGRALATDTGVRIGLDALAALEAQQRVQLLMALSHFRSPEVLGWIEANICEPYTEQWGHLAACSSFDWPTAKRWLSSGRPLSLVAIDALLACRPPRPGQSVSMREIAPAIAPGADPVEMRSVLCACRDYDRSPRVDRAVGQVLSDLELILGRADASRR